jgi:hypothetical protein
LAFVGYETGLIGGLDPLKVSSGVLYGMLSVGGEHSNPQILRDMGEFLFITKKTFVNQNREWFPRKYLEREGVAQHRGKNQSDDGAALMMGWNVKGYCTAIGIEFGNGSWLLECTAAPNRGDKKFMRFVTDGPLPLMTPSRR